MCSWGFIWLVRGLFRGELEFGGIEVELVIFLFFIIGFLNFYVEKVAL